jgi:hypothetical protein
MNCQHCKAVLDYDAVNPFCDNCWFTSIKDSTTSEALAILKWIARIDD